MHGDLVVQGYNFFCLRTFFTLGYPEFDSLTFRKAAETVASNVSVVGEYVGAVAFLFDEAEAFGVVKPLNGSSGFFVAMRLVGVVMRMRQ